MSVVNFLNSKPMYYKKIDFTRMHRAYETIKDKLIIPKIIHIIGTNGKGSVGRFLANALYKKGFRVGHYSSPHIIEFNERIYKNGNNVSYKELDLAHNKLQSILAKQYVDSLSYFEYTTFLAIISFVDCDYVVLEAGMGGEFDATSVFDNMFSILTNVDLDHQEFLGDNIKDIATTKLKSVKHFCISFINKELIEVIKNLNIKYYDINNILNEYEHRLAFDLSSNLAGFLENNLKLAMGAFKKLGFNIKRSYFKGFNLPGRMQKISPNVFIDVGHNKLAAKVLVNEIKDIKPILVYNSLFDKDYKGILNILKPYIKSVKILKIKDDRLAKEEDIIACLDGLSVSYFKNIDKKETYLVFGSFKVVETFLRDYFGK